VATPNTKREFRILGPFEVSEDGRPLPVGSGKQRALLAVLLLNAGEIVSTDRLIDALWGESPPASALNSVHVYVSQLRRLMGDRCLVTRGHGYLLALEPGQLDLVRFEELLDEGRQRLAEGDAERAAEVLHHALDLWGGAPLVEFASEPFAQREIARLEELRLAALEARIEADLIRGRHTEVIGELNALTTGNPLNERFWAQLMLALYRSGRQAEALGAYQRARRTLLAEVGLAPGAVLRQLEKTILAHHPSLELAERVPRAPARPRERFRRRRMLTATAGGIVVVLASVGAVVLTGSSAPAPLATVSKDSIGIVDPKHNALVDEIRLHTEPAAIAFGVGSLWVATSDRETLLQIDPRSHRVRRTIGLGAQPNALAVADGYVWVVCSRSKRLFQFDAVTGLRLRELTLRTKPPAREGKGLPFGLLGFELDEPVDVAAGGGAGWVAYVYEVARVGATTGAVTHIRAGAMGGIAFGEEAVWAVGQLWNDSPGLFFRVDPETRTVTGAVPAANVALSRGANGIAGGESGVWAISRNQTVWRIDSEVGRVGIVTPLHHTPVDIAIGEQGIWTANDDGTVSRIDPRTGTLVHTIPLGEYPRIAYPVQLTAGGGAVWVAVH
jgi:DNA-binding SARP family transcriptional activator/DNA-binding beta-propeller fold protein YncE